MRRMTSIFSSYREPIKPEKAYGIVRFVANKMHFDPAARERIKAILSAYLDKSFMDRQVESIDLVEMFEFIDSMPDSAFSEGSELYKKPTKESLDHLSIRDTQYLTWAVINDYKPWREFPNGAARNRRWFKERAGKRIFVGHWCGCETCLRVHENGAEIGDIDDCKSTDYFVNEYLLNHCDPPVFDNREDRDAYDAKHNIVPEPPNENSEDGCKSWVIDLEFSRFRVAPALAAGFKIEEVDNSGKWKVIGPEKEYGTYDTRSEAFYQMVEDHESWLEAVAIREMIESDPELKALMDEVCSSKATLRIKRKNPSNEHWG